MSLSHRTTTPVESSKSLIALPAKLSIQNVWMAFLGLSELFLGLQIWNESTTVPFANTISIVVIAGGLVLSVLALATKRLVTHKIVEAFILVLFVGSVVAWVYSKIYGNPAYGTDEMAFDQYAAELLLQHINPYTVSLAPSFNEFQVPIIFHTFTLTGGTVDRLSYPALSFLPYVPLLALGVHAQAAVYVDVFFWLLTSIMMYTMLPRPHKPIALVLGMSFMYMNYVVGGVTDALFMPFLLLAAWRWDRFGVKGAGFTRWVGPIGLGLAMSIKQTAWFLAPFVLVAIYQERKSLKTALQYVLYAAAAFLVPNVPFLLSNWHDWLKGVLAPLQSNTVPSGQGLINLSLIERIGGGHLSFYSDSALALLFAFLVSVFLNYRGYKRLIFILPSIVLFFPSRSFATYLIDLFPIMIVSSLTIDLEEHDEVPHASWKVWVRSLAYLPFAALTVWAVATPSPLNMKIIGVHTTGELQTIDQLSLLVENRTQHQETPYFTLTVSPQMTSFWNIESGPKTLSPGQVATYVLDAPNVPSMPSIAGGFLVDTFTTNPATVSTSTVYRPNKIHTVITPQAINKPVPIHHKITLTIQLYDQLGRPVHQSGDIVYLGQVVYDQSGLYSGEASINGAPEGKSPVSTVTNSQGIATFTVEGVQTQTSPVYFQAFVQPNNDYPFGYSQIVSIQFK